MRRVRTRNVLPFGTGRGEALRVLSPGETDGLSTSGVTDRQIAWDLAEAAAPAIAGAVAAVAARRRRRLMPQAEVNSSYDDLPYSDNCFHYTHPDYVAAVARLNGLTPPPPERSRVLEIGCAS